MKLYLNSFNNHKWDVVSSNNLKFNIESKITNDLKKVISTGYIKVTVNLNVKNSGLFGWSNGNIGE